MSSKYVARSATVFDKLWFKNAQKIYCLSSAFFYLTIRDFGAKTRSINAMTRNSKR